MIYYLEAPESSLFLAWIFDREKLDFYEYLTTQSTSLRKVSLLNWSDLYDFLFEEQDLFGQKNDRYLIDIAKLDFNQDFLQEVSRQISSDIYLFSNEREKLKAEDKKILKGAGVSFESFSKIDPKVAEEIAEKHLKTSDLNLSKAEIGRVIKDCQNYREIIDNLDFLILCGDVQSGLLELKKEEVLPIFMMSFNAEKIDTEGKKWANRLSEEDLQLHMSVIASKLEKQNSQKAKELLKRLILTDKMIKTNSSVSPITWMKLFLSGINII